MADLTAVWRIICDAKRIMAANGRNQWTEEYPSQAVIEADILSGCAYVLCAGSGEVAAYAYVTPEARACLRRHRRPLAHRRAVCRRT